MRVGYCVSRILKMAVSSQQPADSCFDLRRSSSAQGPKVPAQRKASEDLPGEMLSSKNQE